MSKRNRPILFLLLIAGLCLPQVLRGQSQAADTLSSIVGKTFYRMEIGMGGLDNVDVPVSGIDVVLVPERIRPELRRTIWEDSVSPG